MALSELVQRAQNIHRKLEEAAEDVNEQASDFVRHKLERIEDLLKDCADADPKDRSVLLNIRELIQLIQNKINILKEDATGNAELSARLEKLGKVVERIEDDVSNTLINDPSCTPNKNKITLIFIIQGDDVEVEANINAPLKTARNKALEESENTGRDFDEWEVRTLEGELLDPNEKIKTLGLQDGQQLLLSVEIGAGG